MLSQYVEPVYTGELLATGESGVGYLLKERVGEIRAFLDAVRRVAEGGTALDREVVASLVRERDRSSADSGLDALTQRERETLELIAQGRTNAAIARELVVTSGRSRSTSRASSASSTCPPATTITGGCSRCSPTCERPMAGNEPDPDFVA